VHESTDRLRVSTRHSLCTLTMNVCKFTEFLHQTNWSIWHLFVTADMSSHSTCKQGSESDRRSQMKLCVTRNIRRGSAHVRREDVTCRPRSLESVDLKTPTYGTRLNSITRVDLWPRRDISNSNRLYARYSHTQDTKMYMPGVGSGRFFIRVSKGNAWLQVIPDFLFLTGKRYKNSD